jgi:hypothetical protein
MVLNSILCYKETFQERQNQSMGQTSLLSYFRKFPQTSQPSIAIILISPKPSTFQANPSTCKKLQLFKDSDGT